MSSSESGSASSSRSTGESGCPSPSEGARSSSYSAGFHHRRSRSRRFTGTFCTCFLGPVRCHSRTVAQVTVSYLVTTRSSRRCAGKRTDVPSRHEQNRKVPRRPVRLATANGSPLQVAVVESRRSSPLHAEDVWVGLRYQRRPPLQTPIVETEFASSQTSSSGEIPAHWPRRACRRRRAGMCGRGHDQACRQQWKKGAPRKTPRSERAGEAGSRCVTRRRRSRSAAGRAGSRPPDRAAPPRAARRARPRRGRLRTGARRPRRSSAAGRAPA